MSLEPRRTHRAADRAHRYLVDLPAAADAAHGAMADAARIVVTSADKAPAEAAHAMAPILRAVRTILQQQDADGRFSGNALVDAIRSTTGTTRSDAAVIAQSLMDNEAVRVRAGTTFRGADINRIEETDDKVYVFYAGVKTGVRCPQAIFTKFAPCYSPTCSSDYSCYVPGCPYRGNVRVPARKARAHAPQGKWLSPRAQRLAHRAFFSPHHAHAHTRAELADALVVGRERRHHRAANERSVPQLATPFARAPAGTRQARRAGASAGTRGRADRCGAVRGSGDHHRAHRHVRRARGARRGHRHANGSASIDHTSTFPGRARVAQVPQEEGPWGGRTRTRSRPPPPPSAWLSALTRAKRPLQAPRADRSSLPPSGAPSQGQGWCGFVGDDIVKSVSHAEVKRQETIFELVQTEEDYLNDMRLVKRVR